MHSGIFRSDLAATVAIFLTAFSATSDINA
jgi:hypothetical protein